MTFSIVAGDGKSLGVGVVSGSTAVGDRVPWVSDSGAIATQGYTEIRYGEVGLRLLAQGMSPQSALDDLLREDRGRDKRQVAILDSLGRKAIHTGPYCPAKKASKTGENCISIGSMLENTKTVTVMIEVFEGTTGRLADRILDALKAGAKEGGDKTGALGVKAGKISTYDKSKISNAALVVKGEEKVDIKVDDSRTPLQDLEKRLG
ncbi:MAG: DUF1028 domain-containing protein [Halobacteriota archaeon]